MSRRAASIILNPIDEYLNNHNQNPQPFVWSSPVERILSKIAKCKEAFDALDSLAASGSF